MGPPSPAFADEHWSSEGCNPFVIPRLNLGKLLSCARVQHETQLKPSSKSKQTACDAPDGCARVFCSRSHTTAALPIATSAARSKGPAQQCQECAEDERGRGE